MFNSLDAVVERYKKEIILDGLKLEIPIPNVRTRSERDRQIQNRRRQTGTKRREGEEEGERERGREGGIAFLFQLLSTCIAITIITYSV